ncbi:hypothetical protein H4S02_003755 [Coemansia sp. RSA 2611]|nr:hypothetical protein H4S02_003755 [Coemansia sp. RSA 2611]
MSANNMSANNMSANSFSVLHIVQQCNCVGDVDALIDSSKYFRFLVNDRLCGLIGIQDIPPLESAANSLPRPPFRFDSERRCVEFSDWCSTQAQRTAAVAAVLSRMRELQSWPSLAKWRNELYPVYGDSSDPNNVAVFIERAASYNFGIRTFGVHINGIVRDRASGAVQMWVAKRSPSKQTWPGYLDQIVAGGIGNGLGAWASVVKECDEEGGIPQAIAETAVSAGTIQYFTKSVLGLQPETQYVYDLELPPDFVPFPKDGEVDSFHLWTLDQVMDRIKQNLFKPNCAVCVIDFMIRHGYLTAETEPDYLQIIDNIHRPLPFPC